MRSKYRKFHIGRSTVYKVLNDTCRAIVKVLQPRYLPSPTEDKWATVAKDFFEMWQFPNCLGTIGGKHISIKAPICSKYSNCKNVSDTFLAAVCDARYCFTWAKIGRYGMRSIESISVLDIPV